jgi:hypothetical protein
LQNHVSFSLFISRFLTTRRRRRKTKGNIMGFSERFPRWTSALIGIIQLALTVVIIGLEVKSSIIDLAHGTIWVGYWAGLVFIKTILMMFFISK